jgi:1,2-beta-oligoglucan phosphorylase
MLSGCRIRRPAPGYIEATGDIGFLDEKVAWRREDTLEQTARTDSLAAHVEKLLAATRARFTIITRLHG